MSFGALFMLGAAYTLLKGAHVRTDMLWEKFSDRKKGIIDSIAFLLFFLPSMAIAMVLALGGHLVINGDLTIGEFVLFNALLLQLVWPLEALGWIINLGQRAVAIPVPQQARDARESCPEHERLRMHG